MLDVFGEAGLDWVVPLHHDSNPALWNSMKEYIVARQVRFVVINTPNAQCWGVGMKAGAPLLEAQNRFDAAESPAWPSEIAHPNAWTSEVEPTFGHSVASASARASTLQSAAMSSLNRQMSHAQEAAKGLVHSPEGRTRSSTKNASSMDSDMTAQASQQGEHAQGTFRSSANSAADSSRKHARNLAEAASATAQRMGQRLEQTQDAFTRAAGASASNAGRDAQEKLSHRAERAQQSAAQIAIDASKSNQSGSGVFAAKMKEAEQKARQRSEDVQQKVAQKAADTYVKQATGGLVTSAPPCMSNAALGYAKRNPKDAMTVAKFAAKAL